MLKALELVGFKSFADKTRFEFPRGITVVVGPNGSGKSNVVDAIKWVLGEQSVKSLRGKEMADVIFNGSGARRPMNSAEITLTLDNSQKLLSVDAPEVHITRRVYRGGECEYLINRQPSRLRDIRDLLTGTGLGTQAYGVIEQGRVDALLQSSPKERRVIFEEAAGISRFKARKIEALRRLERVEQNLLRLSDIVEEVDNRLRNVKSQAGKARRYKEYSDRLQELRTQSALVDWRAFGEKLAAFEMELTTLAAHRNEVVAESEAFEQRLAEAESRVAEINESVRHAEGKASADRERIAVGESTVEHEQARSRDLEAEISRYRRRSAEMDVLAGDLAQQWRETQDAMASADDVQRNIAGRLSEGEHGLAELLAELEQIRQATGLARETHREHMRTASALGGEAGALEARAAAALAARDQCRARIARLQEQLNAQADELAALSKTHHELERTARESSERWAIAGDRLAETRRQRERGRAELVRLQQRRTGIAERIAVLEELEKRCEGLSAGVKEVIALARSAQDGPFRLVRGVVADLLRVSVEAAVLIEVALGDVAQFVVVAPGRGLLEQLQEQPYQFSGRIGFVWNAGPAKTASPAANLEGRPGVLGRADRFVEADPEYAPLVQRLLGDTWVVENLAVAATLSAGEGAGQHFVTLAGERLAADGTLAVGPRHASVGLISRRSELRSLRIQLEDVDAELRQAQVHLSLLDQQVVQEEAQVEASDGERRQAAEALGLHGHKITAAEERRNQLAQQREALEAETASVESQHESAGQALEVARARQRETNAVVAAVESELASLAQRAERLEADRQTRVKTATEVKVEKAKSEERLHALQTRMRQLEERRKERDQALVEIRTELEKCEQRLRQAMWTILRAETELAELYLRKESFAAQTSQLIDQRATIQAERSQIAGEVQRIRNRIRRAEEKLHAKELAANEVRHDRNNLAERFREEYGVDLAEAEQRTTDETPERRQEVQAEIEDLRRKIGGLGNVNLEALDELEQLESRHGHLAAQFKDLTTAKASLERIIEKINIDSRRLFTETLQNVRGHFEKLFRDLFGGGQADIILDEGGDVLESGIEIVARPPGKEPRSISLLSGGEKTLTCVALLLAVFRNKPSPFCVLDEVDAALDEANIDRFTKVLQDFLAWTQFIIVTHSKRTMTCASTIYGVTMQESGISRQVSVQFDDVSETGEIRVNAGRRCEPKPCPADEGESRAA